MGLLKPCILFVDIMQMCMWSFGGDKINFDRITALNLLIFGSFYIMGLALCEINFFRSL